MPSDKPAVKFGLFIEINVHWHPLFVHSNITGEHGHAKGRPYGTTKAETASAKHLAKTTPEVTSMSR